MTFRIDAATEARAGFARMAMALAAAAASGLLLAGCMSGPTYGTAKGSNQQLIEDMTSILSIAPKNREQIDYKPRPELVKPADVANAPLPAPQDPVTTASNADWPESPEQRLARIRADATENRDTLGFRPEVTDASVAAAPRTPTGARREDVNYVGTGRGLGFGAAQRTEFNRRLALSQQGSPQTRRFLSEPPLDYRQPAATAPTDDIGEDEWRKERDAKRKARKKGTRSWADVLPW